MARWALMRWFMGLVAVIIMVPAALALGYFGLTELDWLLASTGMLLLVYAVLGVADATPLQIDSVIRFARSREKLPWMMEPELSRSRAVVTEMAENIRSLTWWGQVCGVAATFAGLGLALGALSGSLVQSPNSAVTVMILRALGISAPILVGVAALRMGLRVVGLPSTSQTAVAAFRLYGSLLGSGLTAASAVIVVNSHLPGLMVAESWFFSGLFALCAASTIYSSVRVSSLLSCLDEADFATMALVFATTMPDCSAALLPRLRSAAADASQVLDLPGNWRRAFYARLLSLTTTGDGNLWLALLQASATARDASLVPFVRKLAARSPAGSLRDLGVPIAAYVAVVEGTRN